MQKINYRDADVLARTFENFVQQYYRNAVEYDATPFIALQLRKLTDDIFEFPLDASILGTTIVDDAVTVTINANIEYFARRYFTYAHELAHVMLDKEFIKSNPGIDIRDDDGLPASRDDPRERRANRFAALTLLPDSILNALMMEGKSKYYIHKRQKVSYETLKYRIDDFLQYRFLLPRSSAFTLAETFTKSDEQAGKSISEFWIAAEDRVTSPQSHERIVKKNNDLALEIIDPSVLIDRKRKQKIREQNKQFMERLSAMYEPDDETGFYLLAENYPEYLSHPTSDEENNGK